MKRRRPQSGPILPGDDPLLDSLRSAQTTFGELPALDFVVVAGRLRVRVSGHAILKIKSMRSEQRVWCLPEIGKNIGLIGSAVQSPGVEDGWLMWRVFDRDGLRTLLAGMYPNVRQICNQVSAGSRLHDLLAGTLETKVADQSDWEYWDALASFVEDHPLRGYRDTAGPHRLARSIGRRILKYGELGPEDAEAGSRLAADAVRQGFHAPLIEETDLDTAGPVTVYESIDSTPPVRPTRKSRPEGHNCIHGYPPGVCASCDARGRARQ